MDEEPVIDELLNAVIDGALGNSRGPAVGSEVKDVELLDGGAAERGQEAEEGLAAVVEIEGLLERTCGGR